MVHCNHMKFFTLRRLFTGVCLSALVFQTAALAEKPANKKLILIAGKPSHGPGDHEFNAGCMLFQKCLKDIPGLDVEVHNNHWVKDDAVLETADAVVIYSDGGKGHPALQGNHRELLQKVAKRGGGIMMMHYAVECSHSEPETGEQFREWIGGAYETNFSCNPMWEADYKKFPQHPISRGVSPFKIRDEWYFSIRFPEGMKGVQSILVATPTDETRDGPYVHPKGPYPHIQARKGEEETMMWCIERPDGGRGVGFTGGHFHKNWADDNMRKVVLNALLWITKVEVPENGVASKVTEEDMAANLDPKTARKK